MKTLSSKAKFVAFVTLLLGLLILLQLFYIMPLIRNHELEKAKDTQQGLITRIARDFDSLLEAKGMDHIDPLDPDYRDPLAAIVDQIAQNYHTRWTAEGREVFLIDDQGAVYARSEGNRFILEPAPTARGLRDHPLAKAIIDEELGEPREYVFRRTTYIGGYDGLRTNPWWIVLEAPKDKILTGANSLARASLSINLALFAIALPVCIGHFSGLYAANVTQV